MKRSIVSLQPQDRTSLYRDIPFFLFRGRRLARSEFSKGELEVLEFDVGRAFNLLTCDGPPCCPSSWVVETVDGEQIYLESWKYFQQVERNFPGSSVRVVRWPLTRRLHNVSISGRQIPTSESEAVREKIVRLNIPGFVECEVIND